MTGVPVQFLTGVPIGEMSAGALVVLIVLLILTDRLVTRRRLLDVQADRDHWRQVADKLQAAVLEQGMAMNRLVTMAEATNYALTEIQKVLTRPEHFQ